MKTRTFYNLPIPVNMTVLKNGLPVISGVFRSPQKNVPELVTVLLVFTVGSIDDSSLPGIAHFLEHIVLDGPNNDSIHPRMMNIVLRGAELDGCTSETTTIYSVTGQAADLREMIEALAGICFELDTSGPVIQRERNVILQEISQRGPEEILNESVARQLFPDHPQLHYFPAGNLASVESVTQANLAAFHTAHYTAPNAALIVVGSVQHDDVLECASRNEFLCAPGAARNQAQSVMPERVWTMVHIPGITHTRVLSFPRPNDMRTHALLTMASRLFSHFPFGSIMKLLRVRDGLIYGVGISSSQLPTSYTQMVFESNPQHFEHITQTAIKCIQQVGRNEISDQAWQAGTANYAVTAAMNANTAGTEGWANWLASELVHHRLEQDTCVMNIALAATRQEVAEAVASCLKPEECGIIDALPA